MFVVGGGLGAYGWDWGLLKASEIDRVVQEDAEFYERTSSRGYPLEVLTPKARTPWSRWSGMQGDVFNYLGEIPDGNVVEPLSMNAGEDLAVFPAARHRDHGYEVRVIVLSEGRKRYDGFLKADVLLGLVATARYAQRFPL